MPEYFYTAILDRKDQKNNIFSRHFCDFGWYHNESGEMPPCLCSFCSPLRFGAPCAGDRPGRRRRNRRRWKSGSMRRREILRFPVTAQGKEAAVRPHPRLDFFVDVQWLVVSLPQKTILLANWHAFEKGVSRCIRLSGCASRFRYAKTYVTPLDRTGFACYSKRTVCLEGMFSASGTQR